MFEQQPGAHRADVFDQIENYQRFMGVHAVWIMVANNHRKPGIGRKGCWRQMPLDSLRPMDNNPVGPKRFTGA
jgi:hypothetical protein